MFSLARSYIKNDLNFDVYNHQKRVQMSIHRSPKLSHILLYICLFLIACEAPISKGVDQGEATVRPSEDQGILYEFNQDPDSEGNLAVINLSGAPVYIFEAQNPLREIPAQAGQFLMNLAATAGGNTFEAWANAQPDFEGSEPMSRWTVTLPENVSTSERLVWIITGDSSSPNTYEYTFAYPESFGECGEARYDVDVSLKAPSMSTLFSLKPSEHRRVGFAANQYTLSYQ